MLLDAPEQTKLLFHFQIFKGFYYSQKKTPLNIGENSEKRFFQEFLQKDE